MGRYTLLLMCLTATGCATAPKPPAVALAPVYTEASASALAFDPPIAEGMPHPELARGGRANSAIFGYQQSTVEVYTSASDNLQTSQWGDFYTREAITVKSGVNYR